MHQRIDKKMKGTHGFKNEDESVLAGKTRRVNVGTYLEKKG